MTKKQFNAKEHFDKLLATRKSVTSQNFDKVSSKLYSSISTNELGHLMEYGMNQSVAAIGEAARFAFVRVNHGKLEVEPVGPDAYEICEAIRQIDGVSDHI